MGTAHADAETYGLPPVLTPEEVAGFLDLNIKTVYASLAAGEVPGRRIRGKWVILRESLLDWLRSVEPTPQKRRK
jgi:excisionase family DNA binding protein